MARTVAIGIQRFDEIRTGNYFYVDKTGFIKNWWESGDSVTLIMRPRRFGKTLNMSMMECFFSMEYENRGDLFEGLSIWEEEKYRALQGTWPVINLSFASVKETSYPDAIARFGEILKRLYRKHAYLKESGVLTKEEIVYYNRLISEDEAVPDVVLTSAINNLSEFMCRHFGKRPIILLDEYDTPMQEAYVSGFWDEMVAFIRKLFNSTFKNNPYLERAVMTGITRVSKESIFSDLNNLEVVTATSDKYATAFGFTEEEVFAALDENGLSEHKTDVKNWYDGFIFGTHKDIYNPWSIINFLDKRKIALYWANTSSNALVSSLIRGGSPALKQTFERLLKGEHLTTYVDEHVVYNRLTGNESGIWSLLVASGYLKILSYEDNEEAEENDKPQYELTLTNKEVQVMFKQLVHDWFIEADGDYNEFLQALLKNDLRAMNAYINEVALRTFSYFDTGSRPSVRTQPERFYHGFVLGLMVDLQSKYYITSNRESGFGRYDVMLEPKKKESGAYAYILEFKVHDPEEEADLKATVAAALAQIEEKNYAQELIEKGIPAEKIKKYGFAFEGKEVLIG